MKSSYTSVKRHFGKVVRSFFCSFQDPCWIFSSKMVYFLLLASVLPFVFLGGYFFFLHKKQNIIDFEMQKLERKMKHLVELKENREKFLSEYGAGDPLFLEKYIEPVQLLSRDIEELSEIKKEIAPLNFTPIDQRLNFLLGGENRIKFIKNNERSSNYYRETEWSLERCVEASCSDLKRLLSLIEGVKLSGFLPNPLRPQLIIKKLDLKTKDLDNTHGVFSLNIEVLQRGCNEVQEEG